MLLLKVSGTEFKKNGQSQESLKITKNKKIETWGNKYFFLNVIVCHLALICSTKRFIFFQSLLHHFFQENWRDIAYRWNEIGIILKENILIHCEAFFCLLCTNETIHPFTLMWNLLVPSSLSILYSWDTPFKTKEVHYLS